MVTVCKNPSLEKLFRENFKVVILFRLLLQIYLKMAWSSVIGRISSHVLKGKVSATLSKIPMIQRCSVDVRRPYHLQICESSAWFSNTDCNSKHQRNVAKPFSTSASLLSQHKGHDHSKIWTFERLLSAALLPLTPAALIYPSQALDSALALIIVLHTHFGLEAIVVDYIRPIIFGAVIPKISLGLLYLFSIVTLAGLFNLIYNDAGLANAIINVWKN